MVSFPLQERIDSLLQAKEREETRVHGLQGGARAYVLSLIARRKSQPLLVIVPTAREAENVFLDLAFFLGEESDLSPLKKRLHFFPSWEVLPFERLSPHPDNIAARLEGL
jgi:transcription-repair coupling factor (superfamily II helicase)